MYDAVVIGLGSMGASALYYLAKAGAKVAGIEQFGLVHTRGSHSGDTRLIRKAYFESADYIPLLDAAYHGWDELELISGQSIFTKSGIAYFGSRDHPVIDGVITSANEHQIPLRECSTSEKKSFTLPANYHSIFEADAGFLRAGIAINAYVDAAERIGAEIKQNEKVLSKEKGEGFITLKTNQQTYHTKKVVIASGAYLQELFPKVQLPLTVTRQIIGWVKPPNSLIFDASQVPAWIIADKKYPGIYYGFPRLNDDHSEWNGYLKFAHHTVAEEIKPTELAEYDSELEESKLRVILKNYLPELAELPIKMSDCMYTNTTDEHFIIDYLPDSNNDIVLATGFSGHGFKFAPVVGEIITDLVTTGRTNCDIRFLRADRF